MSGGVFSKLDPDIITFLILPHLDGKTLIILSSVSSKFYNLICKNYNSENLWRNICTSTWPSLLTTRKVPDFLCNRISTFPGGYRTFFSNAFPTIHSPLNIIINPPPSPHPNIRFYYAVDIFLHGQPYPFCSHASQPIQTFEFLNTRNPSVNGRGFEFGLYRPRHESKEFIKVKKQGYEEYLKQNLTFSCVVIETNVTKRAGSLFTPGCKPVSVQPAWMRGRVNVVFETLLPSLSNLYTQMVICRTKVECDWLGDAEDKFCVKSVCSTFTDMNGKPVKHKHAIIIILNAIVNGERKNNKQN
ncbi:F-box protein [Trifolium repens]|nr:F-box protein [Trifolium repens]